MLERAQWEQDVREQMDQEEDGEEDADTLEVFDEGAERASSHIEISAPARKGKTKASGADNLSGKKRRTASDFFDGTSVQTSVQLSLMSVSSFSESTPAANSSTSEPGTPTGGLPKRKKKKRSPDSVRDGAAGTSTSEESAAPKKRRLPLTG